MPKFSFLLFVTAFVVAAQGFPSTEDDIAAAVAANKWDEVQQILKKHAQQTFNWSPLLSADVKSLQPEKGGHVYGESEFTYHASSNVNGRMNQQSGGHKVINDDGQVTEYYFKPQVSPKSQVMTNI